MRFGFGLVVAATLTLAAGTASAQYYDYDRRGNDDQLAGAAIGAIAGGVLGAAVSNEGSNTEGAIAGAVIGGIAGAAIAGDGNRGDYYRAGHYDRRTGYYDNRYYNGGYYNRGYSNRGYYGRGYNYGYPTTYYGHRYAPRYSYPRSSININIGTGRGYYGRPHYRHRHYRPRHHRYYGHPGRGHYRARHYRHRGW